MKAVLIDSYRAGDTIVLWLRTPEGNLRIVRDFLARIYVEKCDLSRAILDRTNAVYREVKRRKYTEEPIDVYEVDIPRISRYESIVRYIERKSRHRLDMYDADIAPEQMYLYVNRLKPFGTVEMDDAGGGRIVPSDGEVEVPLSTMRIDTNPISGMKDWQDIPIRYIKIGDRRVEGGCEEDILKEFVKAFESADPDVIVMEGAFAKLPYIHERLKRHGLSCRFHRWDDAPIRRKGGKTFFSYGRIIYRDFAVRLNGRFLMDTMTQVGAECDVENVVELSTLSGTRFQQVASRSFGAVFQSSLVRLLVERGCLVPFKEKPVDIPVTMHSLLKFDRVGHTLDPITGLHHNVAEIDFSSLFPWIIFNYNISPETIGYNDRPCQEIPGLPINVSLRRKGIAPLAIKPLLDRRMHYKRNPTSVNKARILGLKWVLVTSYGYLRFREFKLGLATSHMAIGAFARDILIRAKHVCEDHGFRIVHGIVDSLYIQKEGITEDDVKRVIREIELETGIPVSFEGIFKWVVFLPSVNDVRRPVPTRYYGVFLNGEIKARGLEVRQGGVPKAVKDYQREVLQIISACGTKEEIIGLFEFLCQSLRKTLFMLPSMEPGMLVSSLRISKRSYSRDIPQKRVIDLLKSKGIEALPGQKIQYIYSNRGVVLPEDYDGKPDIDMYRRLLVRALYCVVAPFGFTRDEIAGLSGFTRQSRLGEYGSARKEDQDVRTCQASHQCEASQHQASHFGASSQA